MHQIVTDIEIHASPAAVWKILTDFASYGDWNPFLRRIEGEPIEGSTLDIALKPPTGRRFDFRPRVIACIENRELRWAGRLLIPGLFDGEHFFRIEALRPGSVKFTHGENFTGILVPVLRRFLDRGIRAGFIEMNQALKSRAEHG